MNLIIDIYRAPLCLIYDIRLNMELHVQRLFGLHVTGCAQLYSLAGTPQPSQFPRIWTRIQGRFWPAKIDDISLRLPVYDPWNNIISLRLCGTVVIRRKFCE